MPSDMLHHEPWMNNDRQGQACIKGVAAVRLPDGTTARAEIHWYEGHGIGKVKLKIKDWV